MSKTFKTTAILLAFCVAAMAQKTVAIGITGEEPPGYNALDDIASELEIALVRGGEYTAVNRSKDILAVLGEEHVHQLTSGLVDSNSMVDLGKNLGADYMCVVRSTRVMDSDYKLVAKLIDLKTGKTVGIGSTYSKLITIPGLKSASESLTCELLGYGTSCKKEQAKLDAYQNFTQLERFGTFILNHILGLGSLLIMENNSAAGGIALFETLGIGLYVFGSSVKMPDESSYDEYDDYKIDRDAAVTLKYALIISGFAILGFTEIGNAVSSFGYDKPKPVSGFADPRNFHLAVLPNRNGNGMAYGFMYNVRF